MESIILQFSNLDYSPVLNNFFLSITQPFVHSFQSVMPKFFPGIKSLIINDPGLIGGVIFVLLSYSIIVLFEQLKKERIVPTNRKPSTVYREGFPGSLHPTK